MTKIKILVADDHALVRSGICRLLEAAKEFEVVGEAGTGREAIAMCAEKHPDILVLDFTLPDMDGIDVTRRIVAEQPKVRILVLTMHDNEEYADRLMKAGAKGYIVKASAPGELPEAIKKIAAGKIHITPSVMEKMIMRRNLQTGEHPLKCLSDRELQIFIKLGAGQSVADIAEELCISASTVGTHKRRVMEKLDLKNNSEIIRFAIKHNLMDMM
jgi:two-component system, NarL family, invasion response regulator UvrY